MAFIRSKQIRGREYQYLVENKGGKQRVIAYLPRRPFAWGFSKDEVLVDYGYRTVQNAIDVYKEEIGVMMVPVHLQNAEDKTRREKGKRPRRLSNKEREMRYYTRQRALKLAALIEKLEPYAGARAKGVE